MREPPYLDKAKKAFDALREVENGEPAPAMASRYARAGFTGIYYLVVRDKPKEALDRFRNAAQHSAMSGNRLAIVSCLFNCCHAIAAQRVDLEGEQYLRPEVDHYLGKAKQLAERVKRSFYFDLYEAARLEIVKMRGEKGRGQRLEARRDVGRAGERILSIFRDKKEDGLTKILPPRPATPMEKTYRRVLTRVTEIEKLARFSSQTYVEGEHKKDIVRSVLQIRYAFQVFGGEPEKAPEWQTAIDTCLNNHLEWAKDETRLAKASVKNLHETLKKEALKIPEEYQTS